MVSRGSANTNTFSEGPSSRRRSWNASSFESRETARARWASFFSPAAERPDATAGGELPILRSKEASTAPEGSLACASARRNSRSRSRSSLVIWTGIFVSLRGVNPPTTARRLRNSRAERP